MEKRQEARVWRSADRTAGVPAEAIVEVAGVLEGLEGLLTAAKPLEQGPERLLVTGQGGTVIRISGACANQGLPEGPGPRETCEAIHRSGP